MPGEDDRQFTVVNLAVRVTCHTVSDSVKKFTWKELSKLNSRHNAHVAYRGKVLKHSCNIYDFSVGVGRDSLTVKGLGK